MKFVPPGVFLKTVFPPCSVGFRPGKNQVNCILTAEDCGRKLLAFVKSAWVILKQAVSEFNADSILTLSAATAYYAIFSIGPLLVLAAGLAALVFGHANVQHEINQQLQSFVGPKATHMLQSMMSAQMKGGSLKAVILGAVALVFGATYVFLQLQQTLNTVWGVQAKPGHGLWLFIRDRILSLSMILAIGFLLLVSMALGTFVNAFSHFLGGAMSLPDWLAPAFEALFSFVVITLLFALIFKFLPDVRIRWRDVWIGAIGTSALFSLGKYLLGFYLGHETEVSAYGAGSAFIVILLYVYYASVILYFGAEFTQVFTRYKGAHIEPSRYAVAINQHKHESLAVPAASNLPRDDVSDSHDVSEKAQRKRKKPLRQRLIQDVSIAVPALGVLLVSMRLVLPYLVLGYVNRTIKHVQEYDGSVQGVRIDLYRGAYTIKNMVLVKTNAATREPFLVIPTMDLAIEWHELFHGALVGSVVVDEPRVNFENGPTEEEKQSGLHKNWKETLEKLFPVTINRFQVNDAAIHYDDPHRDPPVDIWITSLYATATNLSNVRSAKTNLPAGLVARGKTIGNGVFTMNLRMNPLTHAPTFKLIAAITNMDLTALNNFMRAYGRFDVKGGTFACYLDIAAADEQYEGYLKPFFFNLKVFNWQEAKHENIVHDFWEAIVAGVSHVLRNQPKNQLATTIPISGTFYARSSVDLWATVGGVLENAFIRALVPKINSPSTPLPSNQMAPTGHEHGSGTDNASSQS